MDFGRRAQEHIDAGVDQVGARPWHDEIDVVGTQHAHRRSGEREIVGEAGRAVAQRDRRGDLQPVGARIDARRVVRQGVFEADDDDAARRDPAGAFGALDQGDQQAAHAEQGEKAGNVEHADRAARIDRAGAGGEEERQSAEEGEVPRRQGAGELAAARRVTLASVLAALGRHDDDDRGDDESDRRRGLDLRHPPEGDDVDRGRPRPRRRRRSPRRRPGRRDRGRRRRGGRRNAARGPTPAGARPIAPAPWPARLPGGRIGSARVPFLDGISSRGGREPPSARRRQAACRQRLRRHRFAIFLV